VIDEKPKPVNRRKNLEKAAAKLPKNYPEEKQAN